MIRWDWRQITRPRQRRDSHNLESQLVSVQVLGKPGHPVPLPRVQNRVQDWPARFELVRTSFSGYGQHTEESVGRIDDLDGDGHGDSPANSKRHSCVTVASECSSETVPIDRGISSSPSPCTSDRPDSYPKLRDQRRLAAQEGGLCALLHARFTRYTLKRAGWGCLQNAPTSLTRVQSRSRRGVL